MLPKRYIKSSRSLRESPEAKVQRHRTHKVGCSWLAWELSSTVTTEITGESRDHGGTKSIYHSRKMMLLTIAVEIWAIISLSATVWQVSRSKSCNFPTTKWTKYHWTAWGQAAVTDKNFNFYRWSATVNIWLWLWHMTMQYVAENIKPELVYQENTIPL